MVRLTGGICDPEIQSSRRQHIPGPGASSSSTPRPSPLTPASAASASTSAYAVPSAQEKRMRSRLREERHAALCVLMDRELLTIQALAAQETLPQARRRFLSTLLSPSDPTTAASIRADQFTIQRPTSSTPSSPFSTEPMVVSRSIVDVCETDDSGWYKPEPDLASESAMAASSPSAASSPMSGLKMKGRATPERSRAGRRVSSGRQQQTRERRRRWSGAERQDYGAGLSF
ncbi:hypothetical protein AN6206.2 [Aspergillus nidulans FGSC A4]|uniref:Uncharacterized protein n=1 Tax=Emericella nidulans (strain FGSC A4 / ATCC 38163 / CBS 112.46 / NRRL 194 / M139) TaxID=227321 RepID=Q5AZS4_EMENI|nr:hypothetical protein [Aspergillus nidulans FGSC A4]EAA57992.1 hypothetical protein AN6206.2 [Aspergillus nidulans FGSC A4]CBF69965.1 TPA: hypothetical protein ANIA_06206 [Aspergillus nidulans FGSC A4]|eukprot:XP_663810.1 hypothetical protein AN6206.2 [Aspergillus nidulans FGSC A4]